MPEVAQMDGQVLVMGVVTRARFQRLEYVHLKTLEDMGKRAATEADMGVDQTVRCM